MKGTSTRSGLSCPRNGVVIKETDTHIVVKWPSGKHFTSRGVQNYHSPETVVYEIVGTTDRGSLKVRDLVAWENTRGKA